MASLSFILIYRHIAHLALNEERAPQLQTIYGIPNKGIFTLFFSSVIDFFLPEMLESSCGQVSYLC